MRRLLVLFVSVSLLLLSACEGPKTDMPTSMPSEAPAMTTLNKNCPFTDKPVDSEYVVEYAGQKVGFCCEKCRTKWEGMTDEAKKAVLAKLK